MLLMLPALLALTLGAAGQEASPHLGTIEEFTVLADDPGLDGAIAWKAVYSAQEFEEPLVSCGYGGMQKHPNSGVVLGLWEGGVSHTWTIYASVWNQSDCTSDQAASTALAEAKSAFEEAGLNISGAPCALGTFTKTGANTWRAETAYGPMDLHADQDEATSRFEELSESLNSLLRLELTWNKEPLIRDYRYYSKVGAGMLGIRPLGFDEGDGHVLVLAIERFTHMQGTTERLLVYRLHPNSDDHRHLERVSPRGDGVEVADSLRVLGATQTRVAAKLTYHLDSLPGEKDAASCNYAGLDCPQCGVRLLVYEPGQAGAPEAFDVYPAVADPKDCASHADSKATLDRAKVRFSSLGIDISEPLEPMVLSRTHAFYAPWGEVPAAGASRAWLTGDIMVTTSADDVISLLSSP